MSTIFAEEVWGSAPGLRVRSSRAQPNKMRMHDVMDLDPSLAVFRRFNKIHIQSLLHSQSKLAALEQRLINNLPDDHPQRPELLDAISSELDDYYRRLLHFSQIHNLPQPRMTFVRTLKEWIHDHDVPENANFLDDESDLIAVVPPQDNGVLFRFLEDALQRFLAWRRLPSDVPYVYNDASIHFVVRCLITLAATVLLLIPIVILSFVHGKKKALIVIALFTIGFSLTLSVFTGGKNHELMASTAAYTAVMVVFVGTNS